MDDRLAQREQAITGAVAAQRRLIEDLAGLTDEQARSASLLPDWSDSERLFTLQGDALSRVFYGD